MDEKTATGRSPEAEQTGTNEESSKPSKEKYGWTVYTGLGEELVPNDAAELASWLKTGRVTLDDSCSRSGTAARRKKIRESVWQKA